MLEISRNTEPHQVSGELFYRQYIYQIGKAFWKTIEKEWSELLAGSHLSINEYMTLTLVHSHGEMTITDIARLGMMHVSTAQNFSKKLEAAGYLNCRKQSSDKRTTLATITDSGIESLREIEKNWDVKNSDLVGQALGVADVLGEKPYFRDVVTLMKKQYGEDLMERMTIKQSYFENLLSEQ